MSKVSIIKCQDYDSQRVFEAVKRSVDLVGGMRAYIEPGMTVLLKPNLLSARKPEDAVDTHPEVVRAVVRLVKEAGATPIIGDSPGGYGKNIDEVFRVSGMTKLAEEENVALVRFAKSRFVDGLPISRYVFDSDKVISIPKLKTHCITVLTAALKNTYGTVTGLYKAECHSKAPKEEEFAKIIAKIHSIVRPCLNIVDGIVGMEGDGPSSGTVRRMNMIVSGDDAVAVDSCITKMMGLNPFDVLVTKEAHNLGIGEADLSRIQIMGEDISKMVMKNFKLPQTTPLKILPSNLLKSLANFVRFNPVIDNSLCKRCNLCKITCPVYAMKIDNASCEIDYNKCIRCLCCHEVCPYKAIYIKRNLLTRLVWG